MSEVLLKKELAARPRELGAVACAGCPFAELGCPKQGTGDCPPPEVIEAKQAKALLEDDAVDTVWATDDGFKATRQKPKQLAAKPSFEPIAVDMRRRVVPKAERPKPVEKPKPVLRPKGQSMGEFVAQLLLPA